MKMELLPHIDAPDDLRKLPQESLTRVCDELRHFIIDDLSHNPGHFASSLGVIELTVALHYVYHTPDDRIVWDVGHQAYSHKILTGRRDSFHTKRKLNGLSGFPSIFESEYDAFTVGHASTSISAALGMSVASKLHHDKKRHHIAVIGDGSMTGGLAFEGLNNACINPNNLLIVLNDNDMAIDSSVGGLSRYLVSLTTSKSYNKMRRKLYTILSHRNLINEDNRGAVTRLTNSLKSFLTQQSNFFEGLNIRYFGPVDGNDVNLLVRVLEDMKEIDGPKILHIKTKKGKGYTPAEEEATIWHAPGKFDKKTGVRQTTTNDEIPPLFQEVFGRTLVELARANKAIVGITPAMPSGCSMNYLMKEMPERTFDVGIAEGHAVTFSAGLAREGMTPFCNIYSSFMQRAYDNVIHDVALQKLDVVFCLDRAGLVGEDGPTHHGAFDLAYFRCVPNLKISAPMDEHHLRHLMYTAQIPGHGPVVIRYPRGRGERIDWEVPMKQIDVGRGRWLRRGDELAILTIGPVGNEALRAAERAAEELGLSVAVVDMIWLKPIDEELLHEVARHYKRILTVEDGTIVGGLGSAVIEFLSDNDYNVRVKRLGIPDEFVTQGTLPQLRALCRYDEQAIFETLRDWR